MARFKIIGGGLAGSECAIQLARRGHEVHLFEMRPRRTTPAHQTDLLGELVCSNSFRSDNPANAVGLLKRELEIMGSAVMDCAATVRVPAGDAFAVDRDRFAAALTAAVAGEPDVHVHREEVTTLDREGYDVLVVATGPLTSAALHDAIAARIGADGLYFYDAIAPIVAADSLNLEKLYWKSRWDKGDSRDYLNAPMTRDEYTAFIEALLGAELYPFHDFENAAHFEGCLPVEEIASRGIDTLRYGPMKPVGLDNPVTGERPHAVVQLRKEDLSDQFFNLVGFQTKMKVPEQRRIIRMIPGLEQCEIVRFGSMHRNTFVNGPRHLTPTFRLKSDPAVYFAGQITGVEGYIESAATGLLVALYADGALRGTEPEPFPFHTALGALGRHVSGSSPDRYQPSNVTWGLIEDRVQGRMKKEVKRAKQVAIALDSVRERADVTAPGGLSGDRSPAR